MANPNLSSQLDFGLPRDAILVDDPTIETDDITYTGEG